MGVDWTIPQPTYETLHAQLDALQTERNAAVAEAKMWQRRLLTMQRERDQANADRRACDKSHEAWEAAHAELMQMLRQVEVQLAHTEWAREISEAMLGHYRTIVGLMAQGRLSDIPPELYQQATEGG